MATRKFDINKLPANNLEPIEPEHVTNEKIVTGRVRTSKKRPRGLPDDLKDISTNLFEDVVLPSIKSIISDFVASGIEMLMYGGVDRRRGYGSGRDTRRNQRTDYGGAYERRDRFSNRPSNRRESRYTSIERAMEIDDIYFDRRQDAEATLARLIELIARYGSCTVGDLHGLVGVSSNHTHEQYGWTTLGGVRIVRASGGHYIDFTEPERLD